LTGGLFVEPSTNIGTELLFENEAVRVWSMELAPGEESPYHVHKLDYVYVYVTPSRLTFMQEPGQIQHVRDYGDGYVRFTAVGEGIRHQISNVGTGVHRQILVELKSNHASASTGDNGRCGDIEAPGGQAVGDQDR
jgi:quercetin dioxygenase-like cupin family protein